MVFSVVTTRTGQGARWFARSPALLFFALRIISLLMSMVSWVTDDIVLQLPNHFFVDVTFGSLHLAKGLPSAHPVNATTSDMYQFPRRYIKKNDW